MGTLCHNWGALGLASVARPGYDSLGRIEGNHSNRNPRFYALETSFLA
jgi:hypothetical protein